MSRNFVHIKNLELQEWYKPYVIEAFHSLFPLRKDGLTIHCGKLTQGTDRCLLRFFEDIHLRTNERAVSNSFVSAICAKLNYEIAFWIDEDIRWESYKQCHSKRSFTSWIKTDKNIFNEAISKNITWVKPSFAFDKKFSYSEYSFDHKRIVLEYDGENIADLLLNAIDESFIVANWAAPHVSDIDLIINKVHKIVTQREHVINVAFEYSTQDLNIILIEFLIELLNR